MQTILFIDQDDNNQFLLEDNGQTSCKVCEYKRQSAATISIKNE